MKKLISLMLVLVMVAAMAAGCDQKNANTDTTGTTEATTESTTTITDAATEETKPVNYTYEVESMQNADAVYYGPDDFAPNSSGKEQGKIVVWTQCPNCGKDNIGLHYVDPEELDFSNGDTIMHSDTDSCFDCSWDKDIDRFMWTIRITKILETEIEDTVATQPAAEPGTALAVLQDVWALFGEDEKFFVFGGDGLNMVDGAPGAYTDMEALTVQLLVPAQNQADVTEIASLFHGMMVNNFTAGAFKLAEGVDAAAFAETLYNAAKNNQWMCGMPEKVMVAVVDDIVVLVFGLNDVVNSFETKLAQAYEGAEIKYSEPLV